MRRALLCALTALLLSGRAWAQVAPDLEPEAGGFGASDPYAHFVSERLLSKGDDRYCQFVTLPTFGKEAAVYITAAVPTASAPEPRWIVTAAELKEGMWRKLQQDTEEERQRALLNLQIGVKRANAPIDAGTAAILKNLWEAMLLRTRPPVEDRLVMDGTAYHFAHFRAGSGYLSGVTVSPDSGTRLSDFVQIGEALRRYPGRPDGEQPRAQRELVAMAQTLLKSLPPKR